MKRLLRQTKRIINNIINSEIVQSEFYYREKPSEQIDQSETIED